MSDDTEERIILGIFWVSTVFIAGVIALVAYGVFSAIMNPLTDEDYIQSCEASGYSSEECKKKNFDRKFEVDYEHE